MPTPTEPRRTALILIPLVDALDEVDADSDGLLLGHGLDRQKIREVELRLPASLVNELFFEAEISSGDPTIGMRAGLSIRRGVLDLFDYALRSAATLGDAWAFAAQFDALIDDEGKRTLRFDGERAIVEYHRGIGEPDCFAEFALTAVGTIARQITGQLLTAHRVTLRRPWTGSDDSDRFERMAGQDVDSPGE
jgi:Arabinose-binding domain of AraC transcription regulator, N-term